MSRAGADIAAVKARLSIRQVAKHLELTRKNLQPWEFVCPACGKPTARSRPDDQGYRCSACGHSGDHLKLIQTARRAEFSGALIVLLDIDAAETRRRSGAGQSELFG